MTVVFGPQPPLCLTSPQLTWTFTAASLHNRQTHPGVRAPHLGLPSPPLPMKHSLPVIIQQRVTSISHSLQAGNGAAHTKENTGPALRSLKSNERVTEKDTLGLGSGRKNLATGPRSAERQDQQYRNGPGGTGNPSGPQQDSTHGPHQRGPTPGEAKGRSALATCCLTSTAEI